MIVYASCILLLRRVFVRTSYDFYLFVTWKSALHVKPTISPCSVLFACRAFENIYRRGTNRNRRSECDERLPNYSFIRHRPCLQEKPTTVQWNGSPSPLPPRKRRFFTEVLSPFDIPFVINTFSIHYTIVQTWTYSTTTITITVVIIIIIISDYPSFKIQKQQIPNDVYCSGKRARETQWRHYIIVIVAAVRCRSYAFY